MKISAALLTLLTIVAGVARAETPDSWTDYLDYAYVYSSAEAAPLRTRLAQYGEATGWFASSTSSNASATTSMPTSGRATKSCASTGRPDG